ncbi:MAG TPA: metallophosphoesterase [Candidatus Nanopelagicaceae bacterium]|nr:metallophosphoesterase [Candidatus Nanopelagicaceae bacterium]
METRTTEQKKAILNKLINSGINISPTMLENILTMNNPLKNLNLLIKETSFIPSFKSHLTETVVKDISDEKLQRMLKRTISKTNSLQLHEETENPPEYSNPPQEAVKSSLIDKNLPSEILPLFEKSKTEYESQETFNTDLLPKQITKIESTKRTPRFESTKSIFTFKPIAKEYKSNYEVIQDPSSKLFTTGNYDDFYELTLDKYNKLKKLIRKRPEVSSATNINNIFRISNSIEISTLGLVDAIHQTKKGNFLFTLEDLTGKISVLIQNNSENLDSVKIIERTLNDQMLFVKGLYNPGEHGRKGIIFASYISKIDIPTNFQPNLSPDPLSIALISDIHIGSKEFEEALFARFISFLNGKSKNKLLREKAGRIKYLVINGDLIDGVGIYPNQQEDLVIADIYKQFKKASEILLEIPDYIKIFFVSGNHEPVRNAIPRPAVPKKYCEDLVNMGIKCLGNPSLIKTHNVNTLIYHGESMHDFNRLIHDLDINKPIETMKEFLICRHLAPTFGEKTQIAPVNIDHLIVEKIPDIFHTGHIHINGIGKYRNVTLVNSGCFQAQTDFMKSFGIIPTPGIVPVIELDSLDFLSLDFNKIN